MEKGSEIKKNEPKRHYFEIIFIIYVIVLVFIFFRLIGFARVKSNSMAPNITMGDILVYNRYAYCFRLPQVNDIIIFRKDGKTLTKRIIGVSGDVISFKDGDVIKNGYCLDETGFLDGQVISECTKTFVVPEDCVFVMGDNRENSRDSRFWNDPYVKDDSIIGKIIMVL